MTDDPVFYPEDLSPSELSFLTLLFSAQPRSPINDSWLSNQSHLLSTFPSTLLKPTSLLVRFITTLPVAPGKAHLCPTHKPLNAILINQIFLAIFLECTTHLSRLASSSSLPPNIAALVKRLHSVNSLWISQALYHSVFQLTPEDSTHVKVESGCEACILSSIGGDHSILSDLRASMLGRRKKGRPRPVLTGMVEAWIDWTGQGQEIRGESDALAKDITKCRRGMQNERRQTRKYGRDNGVDDVLNWKQQWACAIETETSTERPVSSAETITCLHAASRGLIVLNAESGTFHRIDREIQRPKMRQAYTESVYSSNNRGSEEYALSYQNLLGIPEDDEEHI